MTCKNCIHYDVCDGYRTFDVEINHKECSDFKDQSRFIELPCNMGDTVYSTYYGLVHGKGETIVPCKVIAIEVTPNNSLLIKTIPDHYKTMDDIFIQSFGETAFLTYEEAEKAIEKRDN